MLHDQKRAAPHGALPVEYNTVTNITLKANINQFLGLSILPKDILTCRPEESNQRPSDNKVLALPLTRVYTAILKLNVIPFNTFFIPSQYFLIPARL